MMDKPRSVSVDEHERIVAEVPTAKYDAKFSRPEEGSDVVEAYDKLDQREAVSDEVLKFGKAARKIWNGENRTHLKLLSFDGLLRGWVITATMAYIIFFLACFAGEFVAQNGGRIGAFAAVVVHIIVAIVFFVYYLVRDRDLRDKLDKVREKLAQHYDAEVEQINHNEMSQALQLLPTVGVNEKEAERAAELLIDIATYWRVLERIPIYIANTWLFDRIQAREERDDRQRVAIPVLIFLNIVFIGAAIAAYLWPEGFSLLGGVGAFLGDSFRGYFPSLAASAAVVASGGYYCARRKWRDDILLHVNAGLAVPDDDELFIKKHRIAWEKKWSQKLMPINWQTRIAEMDPTPVITKNYRDLFHAYMKAAAS